jgi:hypothetical protein
MIEKGLPTIDELHKEGYLTLTELRDYGYFTHRISKKFRETANFTGFEIRNALAKNQKKAMMAKPEEVKKYMMGMMCKMQEKELRERGYRRLSEESLRLGKSHQYLSTMLKESGYKMPMIFIGKTCRMALPKDVDVFCEYLHDRHIKSKIRAAQERQIREEKERQERQIRQEKAEQERQKRQMQAEPDDTRYNADAIIQALGIASARDKRLPGKYWIVKYE